MGVIGMGMGRNHAVAFRDCAEAELVAICDTDDGRLEQVSHEVHPRRTYTEMDALLADPEIAAVSICVPNALHCVAAVKALEAGKHVLCEKPLAMNAVEGARMVETARRLDRTLMLHFNYRFQPTSQAVKRFVDDGKLGEIYFARTHWHRNRGIPGIGRWFTQKSMSGGGALIDLGVHRLDLALWLMGFPKPVAVSGAAYNFLGQEIAGREGHAFDVDDLAAAFIRFENGATLAMEASWAGNSEKREDQATQLWGRRGGAVLRNYDEGYQYETRVFLDRDGHLETHWPEIHQDGETPQQHFCRALIQGTETMAPGEHGLTVMRILDAIYESARIGSEIRL